MERRERVVPSSSYHNDDDNGRQSHGPELNGTTTSASFATSVTPVSLGLATSSSAPGTDHTVIHSLWTVPVMSTSAMTLGSVSSVPMVT